MYSKYEVSCILSMKYLAIMITSAPSKVHIQTCNEDIDN